jgi:hypothetical protein
MAGIGKKATDKDYLEQWQKYCDNFRNATPTDLNETQADKFRRIHRLENNPEEWFKYYFPHYCTAKPAAFHIAAAKRLIQNPEWFEVRSWSRELGKSARSMMEICFLALTGKIKNMLLVSNSHDNAVSLLLPFKACFEANQRMENDYGKQPVTGMWTSDKFAIKAGCMFRALGWGESPRGTRNNEKRPDFILIDDFDTDEECRNEDTMRNKINWLEQALIPTRSISNPTRILVNGNIIHDNCAVKYLGENVADKFDIVNIRDKDGKSTWPEKNSEEQIDRVLSTISYESAQKEYFNNPMDGGTVFKDLVFGKVPALKNCAVLVYADPATSNKDVSSGSYKAVGIIAKQGFNYYIIKTWLDTMSTAHFVEALFSAYNAAVSAGAENVKVWIENNSLQAPFFEQVLQPAVFQYSEQTGVMLPLMTDARAKQDKYTRIEGLLEPINRAGQLIFNEKEHDNPDMKRLAAQFRNFSRKQKRMDGPDMVEGGVFILKQSEATEVLDRGIYTVKRKNKFKL